MELPVSIRDVGENAFPEESNDLGQAILNLPNNELSRPIPRLADGAKMLYDFAK